MRKLEDSMNSNLAMIPGINSTNPSLLKGGQDFLDEQSRRVAGQLNHSGNFGIGKYKSNAAEI